MSRPRNLALVAMLLVVAALVGSLVLGLRRPAPAPRTRTNAAPAERIRVEVLNGAGVSGLARGVTYILRDVSAIDVVFFGNAPQFGRDSSVVVDRVGRPELARRVAEELGIDLVRSEPDTSLYLDVSVILGEDWHGEVPLLPGLRLPGEAQR